MDLGWVAIALGDLAWVTVAFALGLVARAVGLPPMIGFIGAGFLLHAQGAVSGQMLEKLSDLGITLLLFTIGLKLNLRTLVRPEVMAVTLLHMGIVVAVVSMALLGVAAAGVAAFAGLDLYSAALVAFALSFSSTVFVAKALEERGDTNTLHGRIAISILIVQDLVAVVFLAASTGKWPSPLAFLVLGLIPLRPLFQGLLVRVGHGELLVLYGLLLALGGAELFELVGLKGDLGALAAGVLIAGHIKTEELAKTMLGFKDLFLLGFFLSIGLSGSPSLTILWIAAALTPLIFLKGALFFLLMSAFRLRTRTATLASINLSNYSEFGLIVGAIGVANGWLPPEWLVILALALTLSFMVSAPLNASASAIHAALRPRLHKLERQHRIPEDRAIDLRNARIAVIGMGGVGTGTYEAMEAHYPGHVVGVDVNPLIVQEHDLSGRHVIIGDPGDPDFWDRMQASHSLEVIMLTLPIPVTSLAVIRQLRKTGFQGQIAATARFPDQEERLLEAGANMVFNTFTEAGAGFAAHVTRILSADHHGEGHKAG
jgi:predicted Kef-type K+ transport protein